MSTLKASVLLWWLEICQKLVGGAPHSTIAAVVGRGFRCFPRKPSEVLAKLLQGSTTPRRTPWQSPSLRCIFAPCRFRVGLGNILTDVHKLAGICSCAHDIHWSEVSLCPVPCNAR